MFLAKTKPTSLVLLVAIVLSVGAVTLTYGAGAEPATKTKADRYDLEALRLEIEALRASLQATRERVKSLEADVVAQKALESNRKVSRIYPVRDLVLLDSKTGRTSVHQMMDYDGDGFPDLLIANEGTGKVHQRVRLGDRITTVKPDVKPAAKAPNADADLRAATAKVLLDPTDTKAREALLKAVEEMNRQTKPKPAEQAK